MDILKRLRTLLGLLLLSLLTACTDTNESAESHQTAQSSPAEQLIVYKSPKCGCCKKWIDHETEHEKQYNHNSNYLH